MGVTCNEYEPSALTQKLQQSVASILSGAFNNIAPRGFGEVPQSLRNLAEKGTLGLCKKGVP